MARTAVLNTGALFRKVGYEPHLSQRAIHRSRARHRVCACGRRFGKSIVGGHELFKEAVATRYIRNMLDETGKRREFWIVGPEYTDSEKEFRTLYNTLRARDAPFDRPGTYYNAHDSDMQISMYDGKFLCIGKSAKHPERLVGEGLNGVVMAEAAKQREWNWTKFIRPMLSDYGGWSLFTSTPEGKNWFYDLWMRGQSEEDGDWESWRMPSWKNPIVYPLGAKDPEILSLRKDLSEETFNQEIGARFTEFVGRVFKGFAEEIHVRDLTFNSAWETYAAVDYGFTNPFVWLLIQVDPHGNVFVLDEYYQDGLTIDEAADMVLERGLVPQSLITFYPDPASPGDTRALENRFNVRASGGTGGELKDRLRLIRASLKERESGRPRLVINRRCRDTIREMNDYRYPRSAAEAAARGQAVPENPLKKDDHTPEALGRFFIGYFGAPADGGTRQSDADMAA